MNPIKSISLSILFISMFFNVGYSSHNQYDSLKIKISQMLVFGIQDVQKVMEADSMLDAYANTHLGGVILVQDQRLRQVGMSLFIFSVSKQERSSVPIHIVVLREPGLFLVLLDHLQC